MKGATLKPVDAALIVNESLPIISATLPQNITIDKQIQQNCRTILADPQLLRQMLINLCINACHAMKKNGGILKIQLAEIEGQSASDILDSLSANCD
jgi:signal transduction histidine kinase